MGWDCGVVGCCVGLARQPVGEVGKPGKKEKRKEKEKGKRKGKGKGKGRRGGVERGE